MKIFLKDSWNYLHSHKGSEYFVNEFNQADLYEYSFFGYTSPLFQKKTIFVDTNWDIYGIDVEWLPKIHWKYFLIEKYDECNGINHILYYFEHLTWIALHTLSLISSEVKVIIPIFECTEKITCTDFIQSPIFPSEKNILITRSIIVPDNLVVSQTLYKLYSILIQKMNTCPSNNIFLEDAILSLLPVKIWCYTIFFLQSRLKFKIQDFFHTYVPIISLHIPVARSKYIKDLFESLLLQTQMNFKIFIWVDGYNTKQTSDILKVLNQYKDKFHNFDYFVNRKNLWVWKTRWKLLQRDKTSRYVVFLDDDNFLSSFAIDELYKNIHQYPNMGMYSISNIDVRFDVDYHDYIHASWPFNQPSVYTNRERVNRLPVYCNQEETPLIHDRFYSDLLNISYQSVFDNCSVDMVFNRFLEILCWNINLAWIYQFMRIWHQFHQTRENGFEYKEFKYVMYILKTISYLNNNNYYYTYLIKTQIPKQNELFTK